MSEGELWRDQGYPVRNAIPIFDRASVVIVDVKLDRAEVPRPELGLADFTIPVEIRRLVSLLDELKDGSIQRLELQAGIPRRLIFEVG